MQDYLSPCCTPIGSPCCTPIGSPSSSPSSSPCRRLFRTPIGSPIDRQGLQKFPKKSPQKSLGLHQGSNIMSPSIKKDGNKSVQLQPPDAPAKKKISTEPIKWLPVLTELSKHFDLLEKIGKGSFGKVFAARLKNNPCDSPPITVALKRIRMGGRSSPTDVRMEAANFGSPGCVPGFGASSSNGSEYYGISPIAIPLNNFKLSSEKFKAINALTMDALNVAPFSVVMDASPENMGFIPAGTPTLVLDENGLPCIGKPIEKDCVKILDLGNAESPNDCTAKYGAVFGEDEMQSEEEKSKYRKFKCEMMTALLRNRISEFPRDEYDIVRNLCKDYGYTYAAGDRCEPLKY
jgi:hypothetical protein